jgi:hypothetical protein
VCSSNCISGKPTFRTLTTTKPQFSTSEETEQLPISMLNSAPHNINRNQAIQTANWMLPYAHKNGTMASEFLLQNVAHQVGAFVKHCFSLTRWRRATHIWVVPHR